VGNAHTLTPLERPGVRPLGIDIEVAGTEEGDAPMMGIGSSLAPQERPGALPMGNESALAG
jgi:hypothetical protein